MAFCGNCGAALEDDVKVCGACGAPDDDEPIVEAAPEAQPEIEEPVV
ncbi:MAG: zinc ribbon domain-containing protein, partial [Oscillospiraceae bacterium]|nr:zinc ribbon domain-containing protein [Oscillospiraceae bacterium]